MHHLEQRKNEKKELVRLCTELSRAVYARERETRKYYCLSYTSYRATINTYIIRAAAVAALS